MGSTMKLSPPPFANLGIADIRTESIESPHLLNIVFLQFRFLADGKDLGLRKASMGNFKVGREFRF